MLARLRDVCETSRNVPLSESTRTEGIAFLRWLEDRHFTFLGARNYDLQRDAGQVRLVAHWIDRLNAAGVPCGRVLSLAEVFADPQTQHQQMRITIEHPQHGPLDVLGFPIKFSDDPCRVHRPPPVLGADTEAILSGLGYDASAIAALRAANVI